MTCERRALMRVILQIKAWFTSWKTDVIRIDTVILVTIVPDIMGRGMRVTS